MDFLEVIRQARDVLKREGRVTYRTLKRQFALDDEALDDLKFELIEGQEVAVDKDGKVLIWTGDGAVASSSPSSSTQPQSQAPASSTRTGSACRRTSPIDGDVL